MWLLDVNMDVHPAAIFAGWSIGCDTTAIAGGRFFRTVIWWQLLPRLAFGCLLTRDLLFGESAARVLTSFPQFAVGVVLLPQRPWQQSRERFLEAWSVEPIQPIPGRLIQWPSR